MNPKLCDAVEWKPVSKGHLSEYLDPDVGIPDLSSLVSTTLSNPPYMIQSTTTLENLHNDHRIIIPCP